MIREISCVKNPLYGIPVLMSGLGSLVLRKTETVLLGHYIKCNVENLLQLQSSTPECVVFFLAGMLPGKAQLHLKQLSNFGMICRLSDSVLNKHARNVLITSKPSCKSWFFQIRELCILYDLPHPLELLECPSTKTSLKTLIKKKIMSHWESELSNQSELPSLAYFKPQFMSLKRPHPMVLHHMKL